VDHILFITISGGAAQLTLGLNLSDVYQMKVYPRFGKLLDARIIDRATFSKYDGKFPVLLQNVFDSGHERLWEKLQAFLADKRIHFETRLDRKKSDHITHFEDQILSLDMFSAMVKKGSHARSFLLHDESLLLGCDFKQDFELPYDLFGINYFDYFPSRMRSGHALYMGSKGYRSHLHCDPYQWTGNIQVVCASEIIIVDPVICCRNELFS
jgi:hypothetical protein